MKNFMINKQRGFSLIEALVSVLVITVGAVLVGTLTTNATKNSSYAMNFNEATDLAQNKLQEFLNYQQIDTQSGLVTYDGISNGSDTVSLNGTSYTRTWTQSTSSSPTAYKNIDVNVSWSGLSGTETVTLSERIAPIDPEWQGAFFMGASASAPPTPP